MAYVTELGFYVFYIDCHHVTLTDRKKVVKPIARAKQLTRVQKQMNARPATALKYQDQILAPTQHRHSLSSQDTPTPVQDAEGSLAALSDC